MEFYCLDFKIFLSSLCLYIDSSTRLILCLILLDFPGSECFCKFLTYLIFWTSIQRLNCSWHFCLMKEFICFVELCPCSLLQRSQYYSKISSFALLEERFDFAHELHFQEKFLRYIGKFVVHELTEVAKDFRPIDEPISMMSILVGSDSNH